MKRILSVAIFFIIFICLLNSCDLVMSPNTKEKPSGDILITVVFDMTNPGYWHRIDEVNIYQSGYATIRRLKGEEITASSRHLSGEEFQFLQDVFRDFDALEDSYLRETYEDSHHYNITYHGNDEAKTVECDNSIFDHRLWYDPEYEILKTIVTALYDVRISLIGEGKYAGKLEFNLIPENSILNNDEDIVLRYEIKNNTNHPIDITFANQQQIGYKVYHNGAIIAEYPLYFLPAGSSWVILPGSTSSQTISWRQNVIYDEFEFSDRKVKSGTYTVVQYLLDGNSPHRATDVTITEKGNMPLQSRAIKSYARPRELIFELNNRISKEFSFTFDIDRPVGYKITSLETGDVVRADSSASPAHNQIVIEPFGDFMYSVPWNGRDSEGNFLRRGKYTLEMWLIGQVPDYRATREFFIIY